MYKQKIFWSDLVDNGFLGMYLRLGKNDYGNLGIFYARFLALKIKYCSVFHVFGVFLVKRVFKGYSEKHRKSKLKKKSLSEEKAVSGRVLVDWTKTFEGIKVQRRKQDCSDCDNEEI